MPKQITPKLLSWCPDFETQALEQAEQSSTLPSAYKDIDTVMANQADLATIDHTLHQVLNYKGT